MKVVVVSSYPPRHCGVGVYAAAQVLALRAAGQRVTVISPPDGDGDERVSPFGGRPFMKAVRRSRAADRVLVHFQPDLWYGPGRVRRVLTSAALLWLVLRRSATEVLVHEGGRARWGGLRPDDLLLALAFRRARLLFHTETERGLLEKRQRLRVRRHALVPHTAGVRISSVSSRAEARATLGLSTDLTLFGCIGFMHPDKGFERAVTAFGDAGDKAEPTDRMLAVIGSVRDRTMENLAYVGRLRDLCQRTPGVSFLDAYLDDADFDRWILAADRIVLPYRSSWSSGVLARARTIGTPAIVADVGGLREQAGPGDVVFETDEELRRLLRLEDRDRMVGDT